MSAEVCNLASEIFGIKDRWHKKIVRAGKNTLCSYPENPPDEIIQDDDIVILDFGPIVDGYEADLGRTYVMGNDDGKMKIKNDVEKAWYETQHWCSKQTSLKSSDLFAYVVKKATEYGYTFGGEIAGHIVGKFPHEQPLDPKSLELDIHPENHNDMFLPDANGDKRHWILELLFIDKENKTGAYFEQLL
ncbi:MAG: M24 family metallopeptidase [Ginsengibacter sp.]